MIQPLGINSVFTRKKRGNADIYLSRFSQIRRRELIEGSGSVESSAIFDLRNTRWLGRISTRPGWWRRQQIQRGMIAYSDVRKLEVLLLRSCQVAIVDLRPTRSFMLRGVIRHFVGPNEPNNCILKCENIFREAREWLTSNNKDSHLVTSLCMMEGDSVAASSGSQSRRH